jgi:putative membrane protein
MAPGTGYGMMHNQGFFYGFGWIFQIVIILLLIFILWWIIRGSRQEGSASEILKKRYARGEISKKEFDRLKKEIG